MVELNKFKLLLNSNKKSVGWTLVVFSVLSLFYFNSCEESETEVIEGPKLGEVGKVDSGPIERHVIADGTLASPTSIPLTLTRIGWYWDFNIAWTIEEGSIVKKDDVVLKLDPSTIQKDFVEKEIQLKKSQLELEEELLKAKDYIADAKAEVKKNTFGLKKEQLLVVNNDSISAMEKSRQLLNVEAAKAALKRSKEKVKTTKARNEKNLQSKKLAVKRAEERLKEMTDGLSKMELKAAQDGLVIYPLYRNNSGWQKALPGASARVGTTLVEIADPNNLVAKVYVPEIDADGLKVGTPGYMELDISPGELFTGKIKSISGVPSTPAEREGSKTSRPSENVRQFEVQFTLDKKPERGMPGMTVKVTLIPVKKEKTIRIPIAALSSRPLDETDEKESKSRFSGGKSAFVYAINEDNDWTWQQVKVGAQSLSYAEIIEGIKEGEKYRTIIW